MNIDTYNTVVELQDCIRSNQGTGHTEEVQNTMLIAMLMIHIADKLESLEFTIRSMHIENRDRK